MFQDMFYWNISYPRLRPLRRAFGQHSYSPEPAEGEYCPYNLIFFNNNEFVTTLTDDNAIAVPAIIGFKNPKAASGIPIIL